MVLTLSSKKIALVALLVAAVLPARANIGDTMTELRQHYGRANRLRFGL